MRVLVGVDDSPYSDAALEFVRRMSWPAGTRIIVASSMSMPVAFAETYAPAAFPVGGWMEELAKIHGEVVSRAEQRLETAGLQVEGRVLQGDARVSLIDAATDDRVDLIVVGSHGRSGLTKLLMGSVASHVVTHAPCSVLVVKSGVESA